MQASVNYGHEQAETLHLALSVAHDPDCRAGSQCSGYLGEVPADIAALVADTEAAAVDYTGAYEGWEATNCANPLNWKGGAAEAGAIFDTLGDLTRQFDAWRPYTA